MPQASQAKNSRSTQDFVPISEVRDGVVMLKDGSMRAILLASSINFALKSEDEQTAFIVQFQNYLNSLDFTTQILIQSRMLDIRPYIATLEVAYKEQLNDLMRIQIREYIEFVKSFTEAASIMTKNFFVVVPFSAPLMSKGKNPVRSFLPFGKAKDEGVNDTSFEEAVSQLEQRVSIVQQGLIRTGVRTVQLGTEEVIELLYKMFNPGEEGKPMPLSNQY